MTQIALSIAANDPRTLQEQVFDAMREMILTGRIRTGDPVPGSRALAGQLGISRNTVTIAYDMLLAEGYLEVRPNVGTFVSSDLPEPAPGLQSVATTPLSRGTPADGKSVFESLAADFPVQSVRNPERARLHTDFWLGRTDGCQFPGRDLLRILDLKLRHGGAQQASYTPPEGIAALRRAIADHVGPARGVSCTPEDVVITAGCQDALMLIARALLGHCGTFLHEDPGYQGAAYLFAQSGYGCRAVPVDDDGLIVSALPEGRRMLLYVTPSHQFPTGVTLSLARRLDLLDWAARTDSVIIEDDYDGDFRYDGAPLTALRGLDRDGRVLYLGTFSKSIAPGLRLGYIVGSAASAPVLARWKQLLSNGAPWLLQSALADFMESGGFQRHLRRIRVLYKARRDALIAAIDTHFPGSSIAGRRGGMHISWRLPDAGCARAVQRRALLRGIGIYTAEDGGACLSPNNDRHRDLLMLGYAAIEEARITRAIEALAEIDGQKGG
ncbi:MAG: PLP-dependent aminotransferase family protein [Alphaproteobacteria bacterium HGW-Alphaproteobacteria-1]|jgi:GntR family transcriptional regulator/MocR family aminotransferase|nr:MAG: PLP-dependent aminotransferase family protein [Alphaproteobacteria bacterium HGW-Alphaproteobacteria-1]